VICQPIGADGSRRVRRRWRSIRTAPGMHQRVVISSDGKAARNAVGDEESGALVGVGHCGREGTGGAGMKLGTVIGRVTLSDNLGGGVGDTIGYVEGREAAQPFEVPPPIDAINAALIDHIFYNPFKK
jgi:microcompartment protein CcmK/EutM